MPTHRKKASSTKRPNLDKQIFTTHDLSLICRANIASIKNWIAKGYLRSFRTPGGHFRVQRRDVISFLRRYHIPSPFLGETLRLYVFSKDPGAAEQTAKRLGDEHVAFGFSNEIDLYLALGDEVPDALFVDVGSIESTDLAKLMKPLTKDERFAGVRRIALASTEAAIEPFQRVVKKSAAAARLIEVVRDIM